MILLQAAMLGGFVLFAFLCITLVIGTPLLTGLFMKVYWRLADKKDNIAGGKPYYKEPLPFVLSIILSISLLIGFVYFLVVLLINLILTMITSIKQLGSR
jgi:uncharacterized protein involved in cysteine biosynthesis